MSTAERLQLFSDLAPELAPADIDNLDAEDTLLVLRTFARMARREDSCAWGELFDEALVLLAAHELTLRSRRLLAGAGASLAVGPLTAKKTGDLSESYGSGSGSMSAREGSLKSTSYGAAYLELRGTIGVGPLIS